jgi:hypothetical protein
VDQCSQLVGKQDGGDAKEKHVMRERSSNVAGPIR